MDANVLSTLNATLNYVPTIIVLQTVQQCKHIHMQMAVHAQKLLTVSQILAQLMELVSLIVAQVKLKGHILLVVIVVIAQNVLHNIVLL